VAQRRHLWARRVSGRLLLRPCASAGVPTVSCAKACLCDLLVAKIRAINPPHTQRTATMSLGCARQHSMLRTRLWPTSLLGIVQARFQACLPPTLVGRRASVCLTACAPAPASCSSWSASRFIYLSDCSRTGPGLLQQLEREQVHAHAQHRLHLRVALEAGEAPQDVAHLPAARQQAALLRTCTVATSTGPGPQPSKGASCPQASLRCVGRVEEPHQAVRYHWHRGVEGRAAHDALSDLGRPHALQVRVGAPLGAVERLVAGPCGRQIDKAPRPCGSASVWKLQGLLGNPNEERSVEMLLESRLAGALLTAAQAQPFASIVEAPCADTLLERRQDRAQVGFRTQYYLRAACTDRS
jgi:hypothetical protein